MNTPEIPPPPKMPTRTSGRPSRFAAVTRWGGAIAAVIAALGGGAGLRALWGQGEEQIRQNAEILATVKSLAEARSDDRARLDGLESRERTNYQRNEAALAVLFAAQQRQGYSPPREAPAATKQVRYVTARNAKTPVLPSEQDGRPMALPAGAAPPGVTVE